MWRFFQKIWAVKVRYLSGISRQKYILERSKQRWSKRADDGSMHRNWQFSACSHVSWIKRDRSFKKILFQIFSILLNIIMSFVSFLIILFLKYISTSLRWIWRVKSRSKDRLKTFCFTYIISWQTSVCVEVSLLSLTQRLHMTYFRGNNTVTNMEFMPFLGCFYVNFRLIMTNSNATQRSLTRVQILWLSERNSLSYGEKTIDSLNMGVKKALSYK